MKKGVKMFSIVLMTMLLSFNASLLFSQSKGKTIKKGATYIGNVKSPRQIAAYGTPAWLFSTMSVIFIDGQSVISTNKCAYSINLYTGGLDNVIFSQNTESISTSYFVKNGNVYIWDPSEGKPTDETGYLLIFKINNDESLTLTKTSLEGLNLGKFVYMSDYYKMSKMGSTDLQQIEVVALTKLLWDKETNMETEKQEQIVPERTEEQRRIEQERLERAKKESAKRKREADSIASQHVKELKTHYSECRFLFNSEDSFVSCISKKSQTDIENEINSLLSQKLNELSTKEFFEGKEFYEFDAGKYIMLRICNVCEFSNSYTKKIADNTEKELENYVAKREKLTKAYNKARKKDPNMKCSSFLISYINGK